MQYEFLKQFPKRMKHVGMYGLLMQNSAQKQIWKNYGFMKVDEQLNLIFSLMLYIMEQSLKEENCTMDDVGAFLDYLNTTYFHKSISYEECKKIGDFIINVILSNEGKAMYFDGYDFEQRAYKIMNISYIANKVVYVDSDLKRTSYYLTDDGYNLLLSTLEIENNMKLTVQEIIFRLHLEKQSYDKAVDDIKNVFNLLRIQLQKIQEAMLRVRRNALNYSVADYKVLLEENMETIDATKQKFKNYRETVRKRAQELEEQNINVKKLSEEDEEKLNNLRIIESYLNQGIDEHQKILNSHFDLKILYEKELELLAQMSLIQRFSLRTELYDKILEDASGLEQLDVFLRPLFYKEPDKMYNLNKAMELQRPIRKKKVEEEEEILDFDEEGWMEDIARKKQEKLAKYEKSLNLILDIAFEKGTVTLKEIKEILEEEKAERENGPDKEQVLKKENEQETTEEIQKTGMEILIPSIDIFKEIMVELIKSREINLHTLRKEKSEYITEQTLEFQLYEMVLNVVDQDEKKRGISKIYISRTQDKQGITFSNVCDDNGVQKTIRCSNVEIMVEV
ncbi:MAG: hypothetical protein IJD40_02035 [Lachnospiraceae bacterium]|nr:hypothetical protein [Lachnospiraceae bacterium]